MAQRQYYSSPKINPYHNLLLIFLTNRYSRGTNKPFRLKKFWLDHSNLSDIVSNSWENKDYLDALPGFSQNTLSWRKNTFDWKKETHFSVLEEIQKFHTYLTSTFLQTLEASLTLEYNEVLKVEEDFWKMQSRINWLSKGDANTKFFTFLFLIGVEETKFLFSRMNLTIGLWTLIGLLVTPWIILEIILLEITKALTGSILGILRLSFMLMTFQY